MNRKMKKWALEQLAKRYFLEERIYLPSQKDKYEFEFLRLDANNNPVIDIKLKSSGKLVSRKTFTRVTPLYAGFVLEITKDYCGAKVTRLGLANYVKEYCKMGLHPTDISRFVIDNEFIYIYVGDNSYLYKPSVIKIRRV